METYIMPLSWNFGNQTCKIFQFDQLRDSFNLNLRNFFFQFDQFMRKFNEKNWPIFVMSNIFHLSRKYEPESGNGPSGPVKNRWVHLAERE